jgi:hypothetical protein
MQQRLGQLLVAGDAHRDIAGVARDRGLEALLLHAPAELEQVRVVGDALDGMPRSCAAASTAAVLVPIA